MHAPFSLYMFASSYKGIDMLEKAANTGCTGAKICALGTQNVPTVLNCLVLFHILDVRTKRSFILLMRKGETACSAP